MSQLHRWIEEGKWRPGVCWHPAAAHETERWPSVVTECVLLNRHTVSPVSWVRIRPSPPFQFQSDLITSRLRALCRIDPKNHIPCVFWSARQRAHQGPRCLGPPWVRGAPLFIMASAELVGQVVPAASARNRESPNGVFSTCVCVSRHTRLS